MPMEGSTTPARTNSGNSGKVLRRFVWRLVARMVVDEDGAVVSVVSVVSVEDDAVVVTTTTTTRMALLPGLLLR